MPTASLRVQLKVDWMKGSKGSLFSENKERILKFFMFRKNISGF